MIIYDNTKNKYGFVMSYMSQLLTSQSLCSFKITCLQLRGCCDRLCSLQDWPNRWGGLVLLVGHRDFERVAYSDPNQSSGYGSTMWYQWTHVSRTLFPFSQPLLQCTTSPTFTPHKPHPVLPQATQDTCSTCGTSNKTKTRNRAVP